MSLNIEERKEKNGSTFRYKCLMNHLPARIPLHAEVRIHLQHSAVRYSYYGLSAMAKDRISSGTQHCIYVWNSDEAAYLITLHLHTAKISPILVLSEWKKTEPFIRFHF